MAVFDKQAILAKHFLFRHLRPDQLTTLLAHARLKHHKAQDVIFLQGSPGHGLLAVHSGSVKITTPSEGGQEIILNVIHPGEVFGEIALLDGKPRSADAVALTDCDLLAIDRRDFLDFLRAHPDAAIRMLEIVCDRLRRTSEQVQDLLLLSLPARMAKTLVRLGGGGNGAAPVPGSEIIVRLSQTELGHLVGGARESINKQLRAWQDSGLIRIGFRKITICDVDALSRRSADEE